MFDGVILPACGVANAEVSGRFPKANNSRIFVFWTAGLEMFQLRMFVEREPRSLKGSSMGRIESGDGLIGVEGRSRNKVTLRKFMWRGSPPLSVPCRDASIEPILNFEL